jgi:hypothetical protein
MLFTPVMSNPKADWLISGFVPANVHNPNPRNWHDKINIVSGSIPAHILYPPRSRVFRVFSSSTTRSGETVTISWLWAVQ